MAYKFLSTILGIDANFTGNVGVGTTTPSYKLDVNGTGRVQTSFTISGASDGTLFFPNTTSGHQMRIYTQYASNAMVIFANGYNLNLSGGGGMTSNFTTTITGSNGNAALTVQQGNVAWTPVLVVNAIGSTGTRFNTNGNVLIGTTTDAGYKLDIVGTARIQGNTTITGTNVPLGITGSGSSSYSMNSGNDVYFYFNSQSAIGRFYANPQGSVQNTYDQPVSVGFVGTNPGGDVWYGNMNTSGGTVKYNCSRNGVSHSHIWYYNFTEQMRLQYTGNLLIGTSTDSGYKLDVNGNSRIKGSGNTSATTTFRVENSSGGGAFTILGDGTVNMGFNATLTYGMTARSYGSNGGYPGLGVYLISQNYGNAAGNAATIAYSGSPAGVTSNGLVIGGGFTLQSATYNALVVNQTYTGLGTNTFVGYLFDPTLDATFPAANVIAIKANKGKVLLGTTSGNIILGTTTDNGNKLQVTGSATVSGNVSTSTLGVQNSAEINVNESSSNLLVYADITSGPDNLYSGGQVKANIYTTSVSNPTTINTGTTVAMMKWYPTTSQGVMIDYVFYIDGGTYMRSGTFTAVNDNSGNAQYVDNATPDLNGSTSTVTFAAVNNGGTMEFQVTNTSGSPVYMNILTRYIPTLF